MRRFILCALLAGGLFGLAGGAPAYADATNVTATPGAAIAIAPEIIINVDEQKLEVVRGGMSVASYPISTSKFGVGDGFHSYRTPLGTLAVCSKEGDKLPIGAVMKGGHFTGEVLRPNAPGRDPIVTRVIRLQGLEDQNKHALDRGIYIHGTPEESRIGKPVSWGCIRMRSKDVVTLFDTVGIGTRVIICTKGGQAPVRPPLRSTPGSPSGASSGWWS